MGVFLIMTGMFWLFTCLSYWLNLLLIKLFGMGAITGELVLGLICLIIGYIVVEKEDKEETP
jgi:hypothetical protein